MPKLYSSRQVVAVLEKNGFVFVSQKGSHAKYRKVMEDRTVTVIAPMTKQEVSYGTFCSILKQGRLTKQDFQE